MTDRWCLYKTHKLSHRRNFDIDEFNSLTHEHALVSEQIDRLEDELQVNFNLLIYIYNIISILYFDLLRFMSKMTDTGQFWSTSTRLVNYFI